MLAGMFILIGALGLVWAMGPWGIPVLLVLAAIAAKS